MDATSLVRNQHFINSPAGDTPVVLLGIFLYVIRNLDNFILSDPESFLLAFNECMACPCNGSLENPSAFECAFVDLNSRSYWYTVSMIAHLLNRSAASAGNSFFVPRIFNRGF